VKGLTASVNAEADIPAAILANNLYGIDIDLRAVQLSALALYLKGKTVNKQATLSESNLACADVALFRGQHLAQITSEMALPRGITRDLFVRFRDGLEEASMMGSLVRLERHFQNFGSEQLRQSIDMYVEKKRSEGIDESYFAGETSKGIRLLNLLERRYDVVFTNPPYMSGRNMNAAMSNFVKRNYKDSKGDLYSAFIERCAELLVPEGRLAMIAQQSFMFISSFEALRRTLLGATAIEVMAHVGPRAFAEVTGEKVNTTAFVLRREELEMERREAPGVYFRLVKEPDAESKRTAFEQTLARRRTGQFDPRVYEYRQGDFAAIPGSPWVYWITPSLRHLFRTLTRRVDSEEDETTYDFNAPPGWPDGVDRVAARHRDLAALEKEIDGEVYRLYEISHEDRRAIEEELSTVPEILSDENEKDGTEEAGEEESAQEPVSLTQEELAQRWVSYAMGIALGRFVRSGTESLVSTDGLMVLQRDHPEDLATRVIAILTALHWDTESARLVRTAVGGNGELRDALAKYLLGPFFKAHVKRYRKRLVYWLLQSPRQNYSVYLFHERATDQMLVLLQGSRYLGGRIFQLRQQIEDANQREAATEGREKTQWRNRSRDLVEELADLEAFDQAITATNNEPIVDRDGKPAAARWTPEFDDGVLLNAAALYRLTPAWKRADAKLDLKKAWEALKQGKYPWAKTAMRYWPRETLAACKDNKSYRIAHGLE
jgi:N-6 DNA Methylase